MSKIEDSSTTDILKFIPETNTDDLAVAFAKHRGTTVLSRLGKGTQGTAYLMEDKKVIKITRDDSEYETSKYLVNNPMTHINTIYGVYKVKFQGCMNNIILQKYVEDKYREILRSIYLQTDVNDILKGYVKDMWHTFEDLVHEVEVLKSTGLCFVDDDMEIDTEDLNFVLDQMLGIAEDYAALPFEGCDFFYCNSGYDPDKGCIVAIDLGYSSAESDGDDEIIEL